MKNIIFKLAVLFLVFLGCKKEEDMQIVIPPDTLYAYKGDFVSGAHTTKGAASVKLDGSLLYFSGFRSDSGPNLNIYLATDIGNIKIDFIDLGNIKGLNGDYAYDLPEGIDLNKYKYVVVWCVDFNVNFGYATLVPLK